MGFRVPAGSVVAMTNLLLSTSHAGTVGWVPAPDAYADDNVIAGGFLLGDTRLTERVRGLLFDHRLDNGLLGYDTTPGSPVRRVRLEYDTDYMLHVPFDPDQDYTGGRSVELDIVAALLAAHGDNKPLLNDQAQYLVDDFVALARCDAGGETVRDAIVY